MILEFVLAELNSPRFAERYHEWLNLHGVSVDDPHSLTPDIRRELLRAVRPGLFQTLPNDMQWRNVLLDEHDWEKIMYINEEVWRNFSHGTRLVLRGIDRLGQPNHETLTKRVSEITAELRANKPLPKMILITNPKQNKLVLLEGHVRATAYAASGFYREREIPAIVSVTPQAEEWVWY